MEWSLKSQGIGDTCVDVYMWFQLDGGKRDVSPASNWNQNHTMSKHSGKNQAWTMDPTSMLTSMAGMGNDSQATTGQQQADAQYRAAQQSQRGSQATLTNGFLSSITADHTQSHVPYSPLPTSVQFEHHHQGGGHVLKPMVSPANSDMTLSVSTKQLQVLVTGIVKQQLFRRVKFFDDDLHGNYDNSPDSVCGMVQKYCNVSAIETDVTWWYQTRKNIKRTLGNHRNNCIKAMRLRFRGTFDTLLLSCWLYTDSCHLNRWWKWKD